MMERKPKIEMRRAPRIAVNFPVAVNCDGKQYRWQARELSEFGILLASKNKKLVGGDIELSLELEPAYSTVSIEGLVVYSTETGIGVRFKNLSDDTQMVLKSYVATHGNSK